MKHLLLFAVLLTVCTYVSARCSDDQPSKPQQLAFCDWYEDDSCCTYNSSLGVKNYSQNCFPKTCCSGFSKGCQDYVNLFLCKICSPQWSDWFRNGELRVCSKFADNFYSACKDDETYWIRSDSCRIIKEIYSDGKDFIQAGFGSGLAYDDESDHCFNAAAALSLSSFVLVAIMSLALGF